MKCIFSNRVRKLKKVLHNFCREVSGTLTSGGGALVRMGTDEYGNERRHAPQKTACFTQSPNTPQFYESERGGAFVRRGTDEYGNVRRHAPQKTACFTQSPNTPLFFESERGGALVRIGTDEYGDVRRHAPQKTACFTQ